MNEEDDVFAIQEGQILSSRINADTNYATDQSPYLSSPYGGPTNEVPY